MKKLLALMLALVMVFALAACGDSGESTQTQAPATDPAETASTAPESEEPTVEPVTLRIGYMNNYGSLWSLLAAREMGYFEEQGITLDLYSFDSGPNIIAAMEGGSIDIGYIGDGAHRLCVEGNASIITLSHISNGDAAIGSCRRKLTDADYPAVLECFKRYNIRYFFYNGGNDSMDTCNKVYNLAVASGYELRVIGIPKTIDNDLAVTDHCPGFGSAAKYAAVSALELAQDAASLPIHVVVMELMGRNAGWITAASALFSALMPCEHLVYLPETDFDKDEFLAAVREKWAKGRGLLVTVSEGIHYAGGAPVADSGIVDGFGHKVPGGAAQTLSDMIMNETGIKSRSEKPGLLGRVSVELMSEIDRSEAESAGAAAVRSAVEGRTGYMVGFRAERGPEYKSETILVPLAEVANAEKTFPPEWITPGGVTDEFRAYCLPLIGGYDTRFVSLR